MNKIVELVVSDNPLNIVQLDCNQTLKDWFYGKGALDSLPMADLERDICDENLANALYAEVLDVYDSNAYMAYVSDKKHILDSEMFLFLHSFRAF